MTDLFFRPGTYDSMIHRHITQKDEYQVFRFDHLIPNALIIDIGCHAGYFSRHMLDLGAGYVLAYDIHPDNTALARQNLKDYWDKSLVFTNVVWRSDIDIETMGFTEPGRDQRGYINTGGVGVLDQGEVRVVKFDEVLSTAELLKYQCNYSHIICKLDCESSEWPILLTSKRLHVVDFFVGEYHEIGGENDTHDPIALGVDIYDKFTAETLEHFFTRSGCRIETYFKFDYEPLFLNMGHFWAWK